MTETAQGSDKEMGFTAIFGLLAFGGAIAMAYGEVTSGLHAGWGFAAAMIFGTLLVGAIHIYD